MIGRHRPATAAAAVLLAMILLSACSAVTRHRVLSFFFDGVPEPGSKTVAEGEAPSRSEQGREDGAVLQSGSRPLVQTHAPYRDRKCRACHEGFSAQVLRTPEQGLCAACHGDPTRQYRYVHGPVAAAACLMCHHPHLSKEPALLRVPAETVCFRCHEGSGLGAGGHHPRDERGIVGGCLECHDPHGGADPMFLRKP